jgi:DNA-binding transcriptional LysR family regulator
MDRLEAMSLLVAAAEEGSLSAAGRKLGVPLPTVSRKIAELEAHLRTRLLVRSTRKLALTDAGTSFVTACRRILDELGEAEAAASGEYISPRGELVLTAPIVFGRLYVVPIINQFLARYPEINVRMILSDRNLNLFDDRIDMAVRIGELPDSSMVARCLGTIRRVVCASPAYLAAHGIPKTPNDLADHLCVTFSAMVYGIPWSFAPLDGGPPKIQQPVCRLNINTAEAAVDTAIAGIGLTSVLSYQAARGVAEGKLHIVLIDYEPDPIPVHLLHAGQGLLPQKIRSFIKFAAPRLRNVLADDLSRLDSKHCATR